MFDAHSHAKRFIPPPRHPVVLSSANEEDWEEILDLARKNAATVLPAIGIHPYEITKFQSSDQIANSLQKLENCLKLHPQIVAISECGLDATIEKLDLQISLFEGQIQLAQNYNKPLVIHCVRAFHILQNILKMPKPKLKLAIHAFNAKQELAHWALKKGLYLSIGPNLSKGRQQINNSLKDFPLSHLLIESDSQPDESYNPQSLDCVATTLAKIYTKTKEEIFRISKKNAEDFFLSTKI